MLDYRNEARLVLRPLREGDAAAIFALFNDWEVVRFLVLAAVALQRARMREAFVRCASRRSRRDSITFAITLEAS